ncbi:hypothetical protein [methane-oxidizing endosymbiont of Gigantopelta aegis]|uniref:hypothetical protein n=1 Tax=methane-oxidizing endosymbiont of Gigantopelta aegis TaxID=2794938 RepID=UPI0018DCC35E|nr:hypothetical protein [methane-oxidizing endosymbiont of Gigantopelta aegis]
MNYLKQYLPLCWFGVNPLDLPISIQFFKQNLFFYFALELFTQANMIETYEAFFEVTIETILTVCFIALALAVNRTFDTFLPVVTAVLFSENVVAVLGLPTMIWLTMTDHEVSYILMFILVVWDFLLVAYVFRKALGINRLASFIVSFFYFFCTYGAAYGITSLVIG